MAVQFCTLWLFENCSSIANLKLNVCTVALNMCTVIERVPVLLLPTTGVSAANVRLRRSGEPSTYWWLPGGGGGRGGGGQPQATYSHISCGEPGRPVSGSSLFESVQAGALVVHSCNPGFKLEGATLRLCQSNGQWTSQLPQCVC